MCFGKTWSGVSFSTLVLMSCVCIFYNVPFAITIGLIFLASKELLQFLLYKNLDSCNNINNILTILSWVHISFQPFFINLFISAFSKKPEFYRLPLALSLLFALANIARLRDISFYNHAVCAENIKDNMCRKATCSTSGKYHLAYGFNLNSADIGVWTPSFFSFTLLMFAPAFIIGDWQLALINAVVAHASARFASHDNGEGAAIWCVNSFWVAFAALYYIVKRM